MSDDIHTAKIPPSVHLQTEKAAQVQQVAQADLVNVQADAQSVLAHVRGLEASFTAAVDGVGSSPALTHARTAMMAARQWVVQHFAT